MEIYKLSPVYLKQAQRKCYRFYWMLIPCLFALTIFEVIDEHPIFHESVAVELLVIWGLVCLAWGIGLRKALQKEHDTWDRYCFRVEKNAIIQSRHGHHDRKIMQANIIKVMEVPEFLVIKVYVNNHLHFIDVAKTLENFEMFRAHLEAWHPIHPLEKTYLLQRHLRQRVFGIAFVLCNIPGRISIGWSNAYLTFLAVLVAVLFLLWCAKATVESPFIGRLGKFIWFILLGLMFALATINLKWTVVIG
ncbi:MAG: hypothetical protein AAGD25_02485 [Cyanobacteria bacterium P01_F01_bin.150]